MNIDTKIAELSLRRKEDNPRKKRDSEMRKCTYTPTQMAQQP